MTAHAVAGGDEGTTTATPATTSHAQRWLRAPANVTIAASAPLRMTSAGRQPAG